jgi:hypothetical protein
MAKPSCSFALPPDPVSGCYPVAALTSVTRDCEWPATACIAFGYSPVDDHGHVVDRDDPALSKCLHHPKEKFMSKTPQAPTAKEALVDAAVQESPADEAPPDELTDEEQPPPLPAPPVTPRAVQPTEHIAVPSTPTTAIPEVKSLVGADGGSIITVLLAAIGVLGGGAGWKFYQNYAKQKHAERMKQLEIEATRVEKVEAVKAEIAAENAEAQRESVREHKDDKHDKCSAERAALESKVEALEARLADAEKAAREAAEAAKAATVTAEAIEKPKEITIDFDEIEQRIAEIEKALKKAPPDKNAKKPVKKPTKKD